MNDWLNSWTTTRRLPKEWERAQRSAAIGDPGFRSARDLHLEVPTEPPAPVKMARSPMTWPVGSLASRQTSILRWLQSLGHAVDYGPEPSAVRPKMTAAETSAWLRQRAADSIAHGQKSDTTK